MPHQRRRILLSRAPSSTRSLFFSPTSRSFSWVWWPWQIWKDSNAWNMKQPFLSCNIAQPFVLESFHLVVKNKDSKIFFQVQLYALLAQTSSLVFLLSGFLITSSNVAENETRIHFLLSSLVHLAQNIVDTHAVPPWPMRILCRHSSIFRFICQTVANPPIKSTGWCRFVNSPSIISLIVIDWSQSRACFVRW
jgi:hypothetical protein